MEQSFWVKNKVLLLGLMSAIAIAVTPFAQTGDPGEIVKWASVGFAALIAVLSFLGNAWKGQGMTIFGIIGNAMATSASLLIQGSHVNPGQFILQLVLQSFIAINMAAQKNPETLPKPD